MTQTVFRRVMSSILRRRLPHFYISAHSPSLAGRGLQDPPMFRRKCQGVGGEEWPGQGTGPHKSSAGSARGSEGGPGQSPAPTGCSAGSAGGIGGMACTGCRPHRSSAGSAGSGGRMASRGLLAPQFCRKKAGRIGHHLTWTQPGAKRGKNRTSLRPRIKPADRLQLKRNTPASAKKSFSLLDRARPVFSFSARRKRENGGCICPAIIMAKIPPPARAGKTSPSRKGFPLQINLPPI